MAKPPLLGNRHESGDGTDQFPPGHLDFLLAALGETRAELHTLNAMRALGAVPRRLNNGASTRVSAMAGRVAGINFRETSGAATALVLLHDGPDANGDVFLEIALAANESTRDWFLPTGIGFGAGCYVEVASGAVSGGIFLAPEPSK